MTLPENQEPSPVPTFIQELATFFQQQEHEAEEALRQNYALHESHLALLELALAHIQADQTEEATTTLLRFYAQEQQRFREQTRLQALLRQAEPSPHRERYDAVLLQLAEALEQHRFTDGSEEHP